MDHGEPGEGAALPRRGSEALEDRQRIPVESRRRVELASVEVEVRERRRRLGPPSAYNCASYEDLYSRPGV